MSDRLKNVFMLAFGITLAVIIVWAAAGCSATGTVTGDVPDATGTYVVEIDDGEVSIEPYTPSPIPTVTFSATPEPSASPTPSATATMFPDAVNIAPGGNIQAAVDSLGTKGGTIVFAPGEYTVSAPIKLPHSNANMITLSGHDAVIKLTNDKPRFLAWNRTAAGQVFRKFTIEGFRVDAQGKHPSSGSYSVLGFDDANIGGYGTPSNISVEDLTVRDCTIVNVATSRTGAWNACGINVFVSGAGHLNDVTIDGCRIEGGSRGVNVWVADRGSTASIDRLIINDNWHDTMLTPDYFHASTNYHVGQFGRVGIVTVTNNYGARAFDCGIEIDQPSQGVIAGNFIENCYWNEYYYTNFAKPLSGAGVTTFRDNTAHTTMAVYGGTGLTIGNEGVAIGRINIDRFSTDLKYGTKVKIQVNSGVTFSDGMYVDGVKTTSRRIEQ